MQSSSLLTIHEPPYMKILAVSPRWQGQPAVSVSAHPSHRRRSLLQVPSAVQRPVMIVNKPDLAPNAMIGPSSSLCNWMDWAENRLREPYHMIFHAVHSLTHVADWNTSFGKYLCSCVTRSAMSFLKPTSTLRTCVSASASA